MLRCTNETKKGFIYDVDAYFDNLKVYEVKPFLAWLETKEVVVRYLNIVPDDAIIGEVWCNTKFGRCQMTNVSTSVKIMVIAMLSIQNGTPFSFHYGLLGDNFVVELFELCRNTNLISLYTPDNRLLYTQVPVELRRELMGNVKGNQV